MKALQFPDSLVHALPAVGHDRVCRDADIHQIVVVVQTTQLEKWQSFTVVLVLIYFLQGIKINLINHTDRINKWNRKENS